MDTLLMKIAVKEEILSNTSDIEMAKIIQADITVLRKEKLYLLEQAAIVGHIQSCVAKITYGGVTISRIFIIGGIFTDELSLEPRDAVELNLPEAGTPQTFKLANHSTEELIPHANVLLTLEFSDGKEVSAELTPLIRSGVADQAVPVVTSAEVRLIGRSGLFKLGLKQDVKTHRLIRRVHQN